MVSVFRRVSTTPDSQLTVSVYGEETGVGVKVIRGNDKDPPWIGEGNQLTGGREFPALFVTQPKEDSGRP